LTAEQSKNEGKREDFKSPISTRKTKDSDEAGDKLRERQMEKTRVQLLSCVRKGITYNKVQGIKDVVNYCSALPSRSNKNTSFEHELKRITDK
jgi:hypothetical protein